MTRHNAKILNFINGQMAEPLSGAFMENIEPATGKAYGLIPDSDESDVNEAVAAAKAAFPIWRDTPIEERTAIMNKMADLLEENAVEIARAESVDQGKTITQATKETSRGPANFRAFASAATEFLKPKQITQQTPPATARVLHQPVGVVGTISPWNLPLLLFTWKIAPALAVPVTQWWQSQARSHR